MNNQVKSKERVANFGEVNTSEKEVNAMVDLVKDQAERLDSRFLEPACGDGNFLLEVMSRKLKMLVKKYKKNQYDFEKYSVIAVGTIYGVDILKDNAEQARERLFKKFIEEYEKYFINNVNANLVESIRYIFKKNIIHGDALTLKKVDSDQPVTFCEWALIEDKIQRRDYTLSDLLAYAPFEKGTLFSDLGEGVHIPRPIKEYPLIKFDRVFEL
tara:strand:- start:4087 stop:4728 length:642 start_codon:yes stop_codon:yes gene_type:complete